MVAEEKSSHEGRAAAADRLTYSSMAYSRRDSHLSIDLQAKESIYS